MATPLLSFDRRLAVLGLAAALPGLAVAALLAWRPPPSSGLRVALVSCAATLAVAIVLRERARAVRRLRTVGNLVSALREGDYSVRGRDPSRGDALGELTWEVNALGDVLRTQRLGELEATALLRQVMEEIDVAVFAFDASGTLRLVNRAAEKLLQRPPSQLLGKDAPSLGLEPLLTGESPRTLEEDFGGRGGPYELRRSSFRREGVAHTLVVLADLRRVVREEERLAWQRLVRVLSHEINNSLAPIQSIARSLQELVAVGDPADWVDDVRAGMGVVARRSEALSRFLAAYARLARLPAPNLVPLAVASVVERVAALDPRVRVVPGPAAWVRADADQLEQLLINLVKNGLEAAAQTDGGVTVTWSEAPGQVELRVEDTGPGLLDARNLFVPFYTTKADGSGIGLVLCRQIAESHRGSLVLRNASTRPGCDAVLRLPRIAPPSRDAAETSPASAPSPGPGTSAP